METPSVTFEIGRGLELPDIAVSLAESSEQLRQDMLRLRQLARRVALPLGEEYYLVNELRDCANHIEQHLSDLTAPFNAVGFRPINSTQQPPY